MPSSSSSSSHPCMRQGRTEPLEPLPQSILEEIRALLGPRVGDNGGSDNDCHDPWNLQDVQAAKSAQQKVYVLTFGKHKSKNTTDHNRTSEVPGSSKNIKNNNNNRNNPVSFPALTIANKWASALQSGRNQQLKLVLRIWKGGSRWWNLNRNEDPRILARAEIDGYRIAGRSIASEQREEASGERVVGLPKIPRVLTFSEASRNASVQQQPCWALLEYVGPDEDDRLAYSRATSGDFPKGDNDDNEADDDDNNNNNSEKHRVSAVFRKIDRSYLNGMIKLRTEFGSDEPHPRWGRVPVDQALVYSKIIVNEVLLPLHRSSRRLFWDEQRSQQEVSIATKTYSGMVVIYRKAWKDMSTSNHCHLTDDEAQSEEAPRREVEVNSIGGGDKDSRLEECLQRLKLVLDVLERNVDAMILPPLDPVLVHMDLQPQNLIFCNPVANDNHRSSHRPSPLFPSVFSVLDWEDAAWADPRFDLILLCRKVCANREQADVIWSEYERVLLGSNNGVKSSPTSVSNCGGEEEEESKENQQKRVLGSIELWLRLETVHSITTMLLQSMDLVNGGRNPWETKHDIWGKLQREFARLDGYK